VYSLTNVLVFANAVNPDSRKNITDRARIDLVEFFIT
jgi:hypothetical protein